MSRNRRRTAVSLRPIRMGTFFVPIMRLFVDPDSTATHVLRHYKRKSNSIMNRIFSKNRSDAFIIQTRSGVGPPKATLY
jgi:hypothetical protein